MSIRPLTREEQLDYYIPYLRRELELLRLELENALNEKNNLVRRREIKDGRTSNINSRDGAGIIK